MAGIKKDSHEFRYTGGTDIVCKRHYPDKTVSYVADDDRALELEKLAVAHSQEIIEQMFTAHGEAVVDFGSPFADLDTLITDLVAVRNTLATAAGVGTTGTYGTA